MAAHEALPSAADLKQTIELELSNNPNLIPGTDIDIKIPRPEHAVALSKLYKEAYTRGDFFAGRYSDPESQIFNPDWLEQDFQNPNHFWFVFTNAEDELLGSTGFFHDHDSHTAPLRASDETQIAPLGRGQRIMDHFFKRIVPLLEAGGRDLETDFVLSLESKGLRRTLQTDLGMIALGIHPHILRHPQLGTTRSEISAAKYHKLVPKSVKILSELEPIYAIVKSQEHTLAEPDVVSTQITPEGSSFTDIYSETEQPVDALDIQAQADALKAGFRPVSFNPDSSSFRMAKFPSERPELGFVMDNEQIEPNKALVRYLNEVLYKNNNAGGMPERR